MTSVLGTRRVSQPETIDLYVALLAGALRGPRRLRDDLVTEARDGLVDATEAREARGLSRANAEHEAVLEFGDVAEIADAYRPELALAQARRTAVLLSLVILIQPIVWAEGRWPWTDDSPQPSSSVFTFLDRSVGVLGTVMMAGAVLAIAACGVGVRWHAARRAAAGLTAFFGLVSGLVLPVLSIGMGVTANTVGLAMVTSVAWAGLFVVCPSVVVAVSARRTLAIVS